MITIDCQTCPVRGRMCGDCFVPVLGRSWLDEPRVLAAQAPQDQAELGPIEDLFAERPGLPLDAAERAAVQVFVRQGMVGPAQARDLWAIPEAMSEVG